MERVPLTIDQTERLKEAILLDRNSDGDGFVVPQNFNNIAKEILRNYFIDPEGEIKMELTPGSLFGVLVVMPNDLLSERRDAV